MFFLFSETIFTHNFFLEILILFFEKLFSSSTSLGSLALKGLILYSVHFSGILPSFLEKFKSSSNNLGSVTLKGLILYSVHALAAQGPVVTDG